MRAVISVTQLPPGTKHFEWCFGVLLTSDSKRHHNNPQNEFLGLYFTTNYPIWQGTSTCVCSIRPCIALFTNRTNCCVKYKSVPFQMAIIVHLTLKRNKYVYHDQSEPFVFSRRCVSPGIALAFKNNNNNNNVSEKSVRKLYFCGLTFPCRNNLLWHT